MSDQEVTYTTLRFLKSSSESENRVRLDETRGPGEAKDKERSVPWRLFVVALGVLCSLLLVALAVLVTQVLQCSQEKHQIEENLQNIHQEYHTMKNNTYLIEEMLKNKSTEYDILKHSREGKKCHVENKMKNCLQCAGKPFEGHWFCCGIKCYYFIIDEKTWYQCRQACQRCSLSLLKIDNKEEQNFLQPQLSPYNYWIELSYDKEKRRQSIDRSTSSLNLTLVKSQVTGKKCTVFTSTRIFDMDCYQAYYCICEKRMD